ncbi:MAG: nucleotide exchange factor GrpE [Candidatus Competibacteraceae bacterium]|jgi:molecular chaperone GrpE|nr:nucleotide exchange factor GrpE [Candidatus Competibacteraceae bacterium]
MSQENNAAEHTATPPERDPNSAEATQEDGSSGPANNPFESQQVEAEGEILDAEASSAPSDAHTLQAELEQALAKAEENWNAFLGVRAEMENLRKRSERDVQNAHKFALKSFVEGLLPVKDSLEMGIAAADEAQDVAKLLEGSELTLKQLIGVLEKFGVQELNPQGEQFNPEFHEAMATQPAGQAEPNTVMHVVQKGYLLNDRLIRPAMVIVAQRP